MNKAMYKILKRISQSSQVEIAGVYFDFVEDEKVDINNNYIVYSLETNKPRYEYEYSKSVYQVAVYSKDLTTALEIQKDIGKYFSSLKEKIDNIKKNLNSTKKTNKEILTRVKKLNSQKKTLQ